MKIYGGDNLKMERRIRIKVPDNGFIKKPLEKEFKWYDGFYKKMRVLKGSYLVYRTIDEEYIEKEDGTRLSSKEASKDDLNKYKTLQESRLVVEAVTINILSPQSGKNLKKVKDWFNNYYNYNNSDASIVFEEEEYLVFSVPDNEVEEFVYNAERNNLRFEI